VSSATVSGAIVNATLKDGDTELATQPFSASSNTVAHFTGLNVPVPANTSKTLTVDLNLSTPSSTTSTSQVNAVLTLTWMKYANSQGVQTSDDSPEESSNTTDQGNDPAGNAMYVYLTTPTFTTLDVPSGQGVNLSAGSTTTIYKFKVAADANGALKLKQLKFPVTITDGSGSGTETLGTFKFYRGSTDITTSVTIQNTSGATLESTNTIGEGSNTVVVTFDTEENVPAGSYYEYSLKATPSAFTTSTSGKDSVTTYLIGDTSAHNGSDVYVYEDGSAGVGGVFQLATAASGTGASDYNVIWSDYSALSHSYVDGSSSNDWANGYLVLNLSLDSTGIVAE
jgi:hypothetical protein